MRNKKFLSKTAIIFSIAALLSYSQVGTAGAEIPTTNNASNPHAVPSIIDRETNTTAALSHSSSSTNNTAPTPTKVSIADEQGRVIAAGQDITIVSLPSTLSFTATNVGKDTWLSPSITLSVISYIKLTHNTCAVPAIAPGKTCSFQLVADGKAGRLEQNIFSETNKLSISGINLTAVNHNIVVNGGLAITPELAPNYTHLSSRAIKLTNTSKHTIIIGAPTISGLNSIQFCAAGSRCPYSSDCGSLADGKTCHLWFEALKNDLAGLGQNSGIITVNIEPANAQVTFDVKYSQDLYVGGHFYQAGGVAANNIAKWDGSNWSDLNGGTTMTGLPPYVRSLTTVNDDLYVGGKFTEAGGNPANNIAKWNGTSWSALGDGINNHSVYALAAIGNTLYAGGSFNTAGGKPIKYMAAWDGTNWSALGSGVDYDVLALTTIGNVLYVGGAFTHAGDNPANHIAAWDGANWSALEDGVNGAVIALTTIENTLYAGGNFTTAGGDPNYMAEWNGDMWEDLGGYVNGDVVALSAMGNTFYVGDLTQNPTNYIAQWNRGSWSKLNGGVNQPVLALTTLGNNVYAGGWFDTAYNSSAVAVNKIAMWDGSNWSALGSGICSGEACKEGEEVGSLYVAPSLKIEKKRPLSR